MHIKGKGFIKVFLFVFIAIAVYLGHKDFFYSLPSKLKDAIPYEEDHLDQDAIQNPTPKSYKEKDDSETLKFKFGSKDSNSFVGNVFSNTLNKILENPKGRGVVKGVLQKMMKQSKEIGEQDLFSSRYLVRDLSLGNGKKAICGDKVKILYNNIALTEDNPKKKKLKKEITIGEGAIGVNLENGIIGMKEGGKRSIIYTKTKQQTGSMIIHLLSIENQVKPNKAVGKAFFDKVEKEYSDGIKLICGDRVKGDYVLSDLKGRILYDSKKSGNSISFKIGDSQIPIELSNALIGLPARKATVSFITSSTTIKDSFKNIKNFVSKDISMKNNNPVILNFKLKLYPNK